MARNVKPGITFYRMDSGHIQNKKVRLLFNEFGSDGYYVWSCLLDYSYKENGYFFDLNDPDQFELFATEYCKKPVKLINDVIRACIKRDLFDATIAKNEKILTSIMMQEVFIYATAERRKKGSSFTIPGDLWLLDPYDLPINVKITPGRNPQTKTNTETTDKDRENKSGPSDNGQTDIVIDNEDKKSTGVIQDAGRKKSSAKLAVDIAAVKSFFLMQYDPKNPSSWFPDRCNREAMDFFDFYETNGWVQGKGKKPIVSWQAAARRWIRTSRDGTFSNQPAAKFSSPTPAIAAPMDRSSSINPVRTAINYLFERYQEDPAMISYHSIEANHYDFLKAQKMISFDDDTIVEIRERAKEIIDQKGIQPVTDQLITAYMKKIAVIEFFKQKSSQGSEVIF